METSPHEEEHNDFNRKYLMMVLSIRILPFLILLPQKTNCLILEEPGKAHLIVVVKVETPEDNPEA